MTRTLRAGTPLLVLALLLSSTASAVVIDVPGDQPTLQAAVAAAALSPDVNNTITISVTPVLTSNTVSIGPAFGPARQLVIRPAANLERATIANDNPVVPIFLIDSAGNVTLRDLDILRNITNGHHLVVISISENILVERCRIGSNWDTTGTAGWANVHILYPTEILLRNNVIFSNAAGTFDYGIQALNFNDPLNSLRLYNNDVTNHKIWGIHIDAAAPGALVLLRNNVVVNEASLVPEPFAFRTDVGNAPTVVTSHNVAFSAAAKIQDGVGQDIAGLASQFLNFAVANAALSFVTLTWNMAFDVNPDYYRLLDLGPLHDDAGDYGLTVTSTPPDVEVTDDIDRDVRPGGVTLHSDRGADQLDPGTGNAVPAASGWALAILAVLLLIAAATVLERRAAP